MSEFDLVIRNGIVVDGTGGPPINADVAVSGGVIRAVGRVVGRGREEIDADGLLVTPGFVDIHTHYDGQVTWDERTAPSVLHGVTTIVTGNCGVGFAPCKPEDRGILLNLMEGIEDLPELVMSEGLPWNWQTFPEYLDAVAARRHDVDIACMLPHSCLRVYVMGARGAAGEDATDADLARMSGFAEEAIRAGAIGFGTSRTQFHKGADGSPVPTRRAREAELRAIGDGLARADGGVLQGIVDLPDLENFEGEIRLLGRVAQHAGRPVSFTLLQYPNDANAWRRALKLVDDLNADGVEMRGQVYGRQQGMLMGLELSYHPFVTRPGYVALAALPLPERVARMKDPAVRARILSERPVKGGPVADSYLQRYDLMFELGDPPLYEQPPENSMERRAAAAGIGTEEFVYDRLTDNDGRTILLAGFVNYANNNLDPIREMLVAPNTVYGLGDGGAHYGLLCDASLPTFMLTHWTRDRARGNLIDLATVIRGLTHEPALAVRLLDRGIVAPGYKADLNVIDYERLRLKAPDVVWDLPAGGKRIVQGADGYVATIVSGSVIARDGQPTDSRPGRLVRGHQPPPTDSRMGLRGAA